ncbi:MAG: M23 family metallopeptidase [Alphaproteobacteria bacterium]|nr:M23 family metallopeptidase [Alphaproteobacteria bacterium]
MKKAPRFPSRWASRWRTLGITAVLSTALGACTSMDNVFYGAREGTLEYPGSGAGANAAPSYVVKYKDTVDGVSQRFGVPRETIIERNKLKEPYTLTPGTTLELPGARVMQSTEMASAAPAAGAPGPVKRETLAPPPQSESPRSAAPASGEPTPLSPPAKPEPALGAARFEWPVRGKVVGAYGMRDGQKNDGIDIAAEKGANVHAADSGTVVYAGSEVKGMGNLLLVSHANGYITAYGNNDALLVKKGDVVKKGQPIAKVGNSGGSADTHLHFEVRRGNKTVDPQTLLPGG